ncbi:hypothetical protein HMPREF9123_2232 [Neisseria bacilliformis ATCC BAA-1200]|uniref:Uncharacterized protein n=1 Tax=Neisseria bacilliformis ATCC BAA-1200 TaxID=888742 RepID=F2BES5_9NEIS|nr:hypothetical protein HMPREF9123_2232 [Neisseria bacilliformis ATCC BAA-1200]
MCAWCGRGRLKDFQTAFLCVGNGKGRNDNLSDWRWKRFFAPGGSCCECRNIRRFKNRVRGCADTRRAVE